MFARLSRTVLTFAIVLSTYWLYAAIVVPRIEPQPVDDGIKIVPPGDRNNAQKELLAHWFGPDDWELSESAKLLESPQGYVLVNEMRALPEQNRVELIPCTMIFMPPDDGSPVEDRYRRAIIMRSSPDRGKVVLHFEGEIDLPRFKVGKLIGAQIPGNVTIYSQQHSPGPEDDLQIHARDIELRDNRITSSHIVDIRWGFNTARGQRLKIDLSLEDKNRGLHGVLALELQQNVQMHLESMDRNVMPGSSTPPATPPVATTATAKQDSAPVEIRSRGPFRFDFIENVATFQDQVDVIRLGTDGSSEQMTSELLSIFFRKPPKEEAPLAATPPTSKYPSFAGGPKFEAERMVAFGQPVTVRVPRNETVIRAGQLEYEVNSGVTTLRDGQEVVLTIGPREIHCRELYAEPDSQRRLGRFLAKGEGWLRGTMPDEPRQSFEASWSRRLHFRPHEKQHVLSLEGKAHVHVVGRGAIDADEIHVWLDEQPQPLGATSNGPAGQVQLRPDRLMSVGKVTIDSPQMSAVVSQLQAWFEYPPSLAAQLPGAGSIFVSRHILAQLRGPELVPAAPVNRPNFAPPAEKIVAQPDGSTPKKIHVEGELLRIRARSRGSQTELSEVVVEHDVRVREAAPERVGEQPLTITGKKLHLVQQTANETVVTVSGQPAHVEGRGLTLDSAAIHLNRLTSAIWTDTGGELTLLSDRDPNGKLLAQPQRLEVTWQGALEFNGRTARFRRDVVARQLQQLVKTNLLEVTLSQSINFNQGSNPTTRPDVEEIVCREGVFLENPTFDLQKLVSLDRMQATELTIHRPSGHLTAFGPGWVKSVRLDSGQRVKVIPGKAKTVSNTTTQPTDPAAEKLTFIGVEFQGTMTGNMGRREVTFESAVRTLYGPVTHWEGALNPDRPEEWNQEGLLMTSDRLSIIQLPGRTPEERTHEMAATGNTIVEGATYTARAARVTYAQAKDLLVIEGNGRTDAELSYQPRPGGTTSKVNARQIMYWPTTNEMKLIDARTIDLTTPK